MFKSLAEPKQSRIDAGHFMPDHLDMMLAIPPKYTVSQVLGFNLGKECVPLGQGVGGVQARLATSWGGIPGREDILSRRSGAMRC